MKIEKIETMALSVPLDRPIHFATRKVQARDLTIIKITTDDGIVGFSCIPIGEPFSVASIIERKLKPLLIGKDPLCSESLWDMMYMEMRRDRKGSAIRAISGLDIALWDIKGKYFGLPLYRLLGGDRKRVPCYASGGYYHKGKGLKGLAEEMELYLEHGYTSVKIKIGAVSVKEDIERVKMARKVIGPDVKLLIDANNAYDAPTAIKVGRALEEQDAYFFEEPVRPDDIQGSQLVADVLDIPVASGELEYTIWGFRDLITSRAVDIIQPDATVLGGITEFMKVAAFAKAYHMPVSPHWEQEVHMHMVGALPDALWVEYFMREIEVRVEDKIYKDFVVAKDGYLDIPDKPGLGIEFDEKALEKYRVR
jgi:D-arabinonate dehydratase